jgi:hypothetical protein
MLSWATMVRALGGLAHWIAGGGRGRFFAFLATAPCTGSENALWQ